MSLAVDTTLLARIEDAGMNASAPPQQRWCDGWLLRLSPGKAKRARCINAVAIGRLPLRDKLDLAAEVYRQAHLPLILRVTPFSCPGGLDAELEALGLRRFDDTRVMVLADLATRAHESLPAGTTVQAVGLEAFAQRVGALRGSPLSQRQAHAERLQNAPVPFFAFELRVHGALAVCGQYALEAELAGLYDVYTAPALRGQGHARRLCRHLLAHAAAQGARHAYLQVEGDNHAARSVYLGLGFADGYAYHYRTADPQAV